MSARVSNSLRRGFAVAATMGCAATLLAACSSSQDSEADESGGSAGSITMVAPSSSQGESAYEKIAKAYEEATGVHIDVTILPPDSYDQTVRNQLQAGSAPDLLGVTPGGSLPTSVMPLVEAGFLTPIENDGVEDTILSGQESLFTKDNTVYAQPTGVSVFGLIFNEAAAEQAGITYPATWEDLLDTCEQTAGNPAFMAIGGAVPSNASVLALELAGGLVYANNPTWNEDRAAGDVTFADSAEWAAVLQAVVDMNDAGCFPEGSAGNGFDQMMGAVMQGQALSLALPALAVPELSAANPALKLAVNNIPPADSGGDFAIAGQSFAFGINASSDDDRQAAAADFLAWLAEPANSETMASAEGGVAVADIDDPAAMPESLAPVADTLAAGSFTYLPSNGWPNPEVQNALGAGVQALMTGQGDVDSVLESLDQAWG